MASQKLRSKWERPELGAEIDARLLLASIVDSSHDVILCEDLAGKVTGWNRAAENLFGFRANEVIGRSVLEFVPTELHSDVLAQQARARSGEFVESRDSERIAHDGRRVQVAVRMVPIRDSADEVQGIVTIIRDIAENKAADELKFKLAAIVESSDDVIISKDLNGIITSWNAAAERLFGYRADEIVGRSILTLIPEHLQHEEPEILAKLRANQKIDHYETQRITKTGEVLELSLTISPIRDTKGNVIGASKIARDISERKKAQRALIESEKLAATARMAATIAHEINNPLESVTNLAYLLATDDTLNSTAHRYADMLLAEVSRASDIARQTLSFYRDNSTPGEVRLSELITSMIDIHGPRLQKRNVQLVLDLDERGKVWGLSSELRQVFVNLLLNAADAVGENGTVRVRLRVAGDKVKITVQDNGSGIPKQYLKRVFDPFFTTKNSKGNGLGLWVSKGIVEKHNGSIRMRSRTEGMRRGTLFHVVLPLYTEGLSRGNVA